MSRSNERLNAIALPITTLSTGVHGAMVVSCSAAYCAGGALRAIQALTPSVYAREGRPALGGQRRQRTLGGPPQPDRARLDVAGQRGLAEQLGERAGRLPPGDVHLEQPVAGVHPALQEEQVVLVERLDVGDALDVADHRRGCAQAGQADPAGGGDRSHHGAGLRDIDECSQWRKTTHSTPGRARPRPERSVFAPQPAR